MQPEKLSSPGVVPAWTGSASARQWQISAPATCGWSPCHLPGTRRRCWTATVVPPAAAPPACTGRPSPPGRRSHPVAAAETCLVLESERLWCQRAMEGHQGVQRGLDIPTSHCNLPHYTCPGVAPTHILYSIRLDPLRGYLPLTSTICHCAQFKVTGATTLIPVQTDTSTGLNLDMIWKIKTMLKPKTF